MSDPYIPAKTLSDLRSVHPEGSRHEAIKRISLSLIGNGFSPDAVFAEIRSKFPPEKTDKEIQDVIQWCLAKNPTPSGFGTKPNLRRPAFTTTATVLKTPSEPPGVAVERFLNGLSVTTAEMSNRSPVGLSGEFGDAVLLFTNLYHSDECVNLVTNFSTLETGKVTPVGGGEILTRDAWVHRMLTDGVPTSDAGGWIRMNPCLAVGTGAGGSIKNDDITAFRFLLLESDVLPIDQQISLYSVLKLPIAAMISSGSKSVHAWILLNAKTAEEYTANAIRILTALAPFGFDQSNKNCSRLSRLPCATRKLGAVGDGFQRILYLNPNPKIKISDESLTEFESALKIPLIPEKPFKQLIRNATSRYEELYANRGRLGVQVGFRQFDKDTGGFKKGQMTALAAGTGAGKSTMALNMINGAMKNGHGVALFTLEMDRDEIVDLLVAMNLKVNRNVFNTGYFNPEDTDKIIQAGPNIAEFPLWIFDDAMMTVAGMEARLAPLIAENKIGLVVVDYVQIVSPDDPRTPREQQVAEIARGIRVMAKRNKVPVIVLSQLNDEGKLRESRVVAHESHSVIILELNDGITMKVVKGRSIRKQDYHLRYEPEYCLITDLPIDAGPEPKSWQD